MGWPDDFTKASTETLWLHTIIGVALLEGYIYTVQCTMFDPETRRRRICKMAAPRKIPMNDKIEKDAKWVYLPSHRQEK